MTRPVLLACGLAIQVGAGPLQGQAVHPPAHDPENPDTHPVAAGPAILSHASLLGGFGWNEGPRGADEALTANWVMTTATWAAGPRTWSIRFMGSLEAVQGRSGYPLLLQTGETADGVSPLRDRQHPHDLIMELSASVSGSADVFDWEAYAAAAGSPELGPEPFMHRPANRSIPTAPITHHFLDATHISHGVLGGALILENGIRVGATAFNAHEPDQDRWDVGTPDLNSFSLSVGLEPWTGWSIQTSFGWLDEPEQLHPGIDVRRLTASVRHERETTLGMLTFLGAVGRNQRAQLFMSVAEARRSLSPPIFEHYTSANGVIDIPPGVSEEDVFIFFPAQVQKAWLLEGSLNTPERSLALRFEHAQKDELFDPSDPRHSDVFGVAKIELGASQQVLRIGSVRLDFGGSAAVNRVPSPLADAYGSRSPVSGLGFARLRIGDGGVHH